MEGKMRSLERAIDLLELLSAIGPSALHDLHLQSGLPKSTVKRLLDTLTRRNLIRRGLSDRNYRLNIAISEPGDAAHMTQIARLVKAASPHMARLTQEIKWPVDLHVFKNGRMQIVETTHALSEFESDDKRRIYDLELNVFVAASGIAYLANKSDQFTRDLIETMAPEGRFSLQHYRISLDRLYREIERAQVQGYARRLARQNGKAGFNAIGYFISSSDGGEGAVSVRWPRSYLSTRNFMKRYGEQITNAVGLIA